MIMKKRPLSLILLFLCFASISYAQLNEYPKLSESVLALQGDEGKWDSSKVHTFSVVEANKDGYKYWGYYGLSYYGGDPVYRKAGLVRSNDLIHWDKYEGNPVIMGDCRWPTVVYKDKKFYMFYAEYNAENDSRIVMVTSKDGIHFGDKEVIVAREKGKQNQNPFIFFDKNDNNFYLAYYNGIERNPDPKKNVWNINIKKAKTAQGLADARPKTLMSSTDLIAAPSIAYYNNKYYLLIESRVIGKWNDEWVTLGYESDKIDGQYKECDNNPPVLYKGDACAFQYVLDNELYIFYSHCLSLEKWNWELRMVKAENE